MDENLFRKITTIVILAVLILLTFFLLRPILMAVIFAIILAFIFTPVYNWLNKKIKHENLSGIIICILLVILIAIPVWFFTPIMLDQSLKIYYATQETDFVTPLKSVFPSAFASEVRKPYQNYP